MLAQRVRQLVRPIANNARSISGLTPEQQGEIPEMIKQLMGSIEPKHEAPILKFGYTGRLASALFSEASATGKLDKAEKDLQSVTNKLFSTEWNEFMLTHGMMKEPLGELLDETFSKEKTLDAVADVFEELWEGHNLSASKEVLAEFQELMVAHRREVHAKVVTAQELTPAQAKSLTQSLTNNLGEGEKLVMTTEVNPNILGGLIITLGDKYLDHSVISRIKKYSSALATTQLTGPNAATSLNV